MKNLIVFAMAIMLLGCATVQLPTPPEIKPWHYYDLGTGICIDTENLNILNENIKAKKTYEAELLRLLKEGKL